MKARWLTIGALLASFFVLASFLRNATPVRPQPGETPLMRAAKQGDTRMVKSLLEQGADAHVVTSDGKNAMDYAALGGVCQIETVIALKRKVPDLQLHEPSPLWRNFEIAKLKACAGLNRITSSW